MTKKLVKIVSAALVLALGVSLAGCGKKEEGANLDAIKDKLKENIEAQKATDEKKPEKDSQKLV